MPLIVIEHHHHYPDSDSSTLTPLLQKWKDAIMAQLDDLMTALNAIHGDVTTLLDKAQGLEAQLTQLDQSTPPQVDLSSALSLATSIRQQLEGTASSTAAATGNEPPASTSDTTGPTDGGGEPTSDTPAPTDGGQAPADATNDPSAAEQTPTPETGADSSVA